MTPATGTIAIFGDLQADVWGVVTGGEQPAVAVAALTGADVAFAPADLDVEDPDVWTLTAAGCALRVERADATSSTHADAPPLEPCRVSGAITIDGIERECDLGGVRSTEIITAGAHSVRLFGAWLPAGHEVAVVSVRPRGAKGQDRDAIGVVTLGEEHPLVLDPRLSTTYDEQGQPRRVGLELWLGDEEDGDQWPRRIAGAVTGSRVSADGLDAYALQCVSRGEPGAGVYVLLRP